MKRVVRLDAAEVNSVSRVKKKIEFFEKLKRKQIDRLSRCRYISPAFLPNPKHNLNHSPVIDGNRKHGSACFVSLCFRSR
jgi:hypothetical protein